MPQSKFVPFDESSTTTTPPKIVVKPDGSKFIPFDLDTIKPKFKPATPEVGAAIAQQEGAAEDEFLKTLRRPLLNMGGTAIGGILGGGPGAGVGAATGALVNETLDKGAPLTPGEATRTALFTGIPTAVGGAAINAMPTMKPIQERLAQALMNTILVNATRKAEQGFSGEPQEPQSFGSQMGDFATDFGLNLAVGEGVRLGARGINWSANKLQGKNQPNPGNPLSLEVNRLREQVGQGQLPPTKEGISARSSQEYGGEGNKSIRENEKASRKLTSRLFTSFRENQAEPSAIAVQRVKGFEKSKVADAMGQYHDVPIVETERISGPIYVDKTVQDTVVPALEKLENWMKGPYYTKLPPEMQLPYKNTYDDLRKIAKGMDVMRNGQIEKAHIMGWETVKEIRTQINKGANATADKDYPKALLSQVEKALGQDIDYSLGFWANPDQARRHLALAKKAHELHEQTYNMDVMKRVYGNWEHGGSRDPRIDANPEELFKKGYTSRSHAQRVREALGPERQYLQSRDYLDNYLLPKAFGPNYSKFKPDAIINELENVNSSSRDILSADERNNILRLARAARAAGGSEVGIDDPKALDKIRALHFWQDQAVLTGGNVLGKAMGVPMLGRGVRVVIHASDLWQGAKDNKKVVDIASRLLKIGPETAEAQAGTKLLLKSLAGMTVSIMTANGVKQAVIQENGQAKLDSQE